MTYDCTEERFLSDVEEHEISIIRDDGVNRHVRFQRPGSWSYKFDLITWPGHLCITGDCGTYVFSRINDMFEFFRTEQSYRDAHPENKLFINTGYWGEKLLSICRQGGYQEFDEEEFDEEAFRERIAVYTSDNDSLPEGLQEEIDAWVLSEIDNGGEAAYAAAYNFEYEGFQFVDFFDGGGTEKYTFHYVWCLYAIAWGIQKYDKE